MPGAFDPEEVTAIIVTPPPQRLYYWGETLDLTGASANIYYRGPGVDPKLKQEIKYGQVSGFNPRREGIQTIAVTIEGRSDHFDIALLSLLPADVDETLPLMSLSPNQEKTIQNPPEGPWKIYIFERDSRAVVKLKNPSGAGDIVFTAPAAAGDYIIATSSAKDGYTYPRFYRLTVTPDTP
jgi:hypothetical protein